jgi:hypothetical protein
MFVILSAQPPMPAVNTRHSSILFKTSIADRIWIYRPLSKNVKIDPFTGWLRQYK